MGDVAPTDWAPESCSLPTVAQPQRIAEFDRLFTDFVLQAMRTADTRLDLVLTAAAESTARDLAAREIGCCTFFTFEFNSAGANMVMSIIVPPPQTAVLDMLTERVRAAIKARPAQ